MVAWPWWRGRQELRAWAKTGMSMEEYRARYPRASNSPAAVELDRLTRPLGIRFIKNANDDDAIYDGKPYEAIQKHFRTIAEAASNDQLNPPSAVIRRFLGSRHAAIDAVADHLLSSGDISWEMDVDAGIQAPLPPLRALRNLHQLLLIEALARHNRDDDGIARRLLKAACRLKDSVTDRPQLISRLISMALASQQNAVSRMMPAAAECSPERTATSFLSGYAQSLRSEAFQFLDWDPHKLRLNGRGEAGERPSFFEIWYGRIGMASASAHLRRGHALVLADDPCSIKASEIEKQVAGKIARWDLLAKIVVPSVGRGFAAALDADLDLERTRLIRDAYKRRQMRGDWDDVVNVTSKVCPSIVWLHQQEPDGRLTIVPAPLPPQDQKRQRPWAFTLSAPPSLKADSRLGSRRP
jgi:hypothetical protein